MADRKTAKDIILEASSEIFRRYGYKKSSMEEISRASHMSRQNLYFHYPTKEALFEATIDYGVTKRCKLINEILCNINVSINERLLNAFQVAIGDPSDSEHFEELIENLKYYQNGSRMGGNLIELVSMTLQQNHISDRWAIMGFSARRLAELLLDLSQGIQKPISSQLFREKMRPLVDMICFCYPPPFMGQQIVHMQPNFPSYSTN